MYGIRHDVTTLAERLQAAGYRTGAFINVIWCDPKLSALDRGFEHYDFATTDESNRGQRDAAETTDAALAWLELSGSGPNFTVVHYFDPHLTYDPPPPYDTMFADDPDAEPLIPRGFGSAEEVFRVRDGRIALDEAQRRDLVARYDGELRYTDDQFARLRQALESAGRWEDALVVVVADHGEEFWDHGGFEHGHTHYREMLRVPLIVKRPGNVPSVADARYRQIDIAPTLLEFAGVEAAGFPGVVLGSPPPPYVVAEGSLWGGDLVSVRGDDGTLMVERRSGATRYYAAADLLETNPLPVPSPAQDLAEIVRAIPPLRRRDDTPVELSDEQRERLRSLGYLQ
jgi:arylsulfatase A-like enzyme